MKTIAILLLVFAVIAGCAAHIAQNWRELRPSSRTSYGYTAEDPIQMGWAGNLNKSIDRCYAFLWCLRTPDQRPLQIISVAVLSDPKHGEGSSKLLDCYVLVPEGTDDTLRLYFTVYDADSLRIPVGLMFVPPVGDTARTSF